VTYRPENLGWSKSGNLNETTNIDFTFPEMEYMIPHLGNDSNFLKNLFIANISIDSSKQWWDTDLNNGLSSEFDPWGS